MDGTIKPGPHHLRDATRIVAVRLVDLHLQRRPHMSRLNTDHRQARIRGPRFTISLKRSTPNSTIHKSRPISPSLPQKQTTRQTSRYLRFVPMGDIGSSARATKEGNIVLKLSPEHTDAVLSGMPSARAQRDGTP
jgi:hypothetical protein